jgi:uncharacterized membrane protein YfcA
MNFKLILIGIISGLITGITGIQYGILIPALVFSNIIPDIHTAIGTILYAYLPPINIGAVYYLYKYKHLDIPKGNVLMITLLFSILAGSFIGNKLKNSTINLIISILFFILSIFHFYLYKFK